LASPIGHERMPDLCPHPILSAHVPEILRKILPDRDRPIARLMTERATATSLRRSRPTCTSLLSVPDPAVTPSVIQTCTTRSGRQLGRGKPPPLWARPQWSGRMGERSDRPRRGSPLRAGDLVGAAMRGARGCGTEEATDRGYRWRFGHAYWRRLKRGGVAPDPSAPTIARGPSLPNTCLSG